MTPRSRAASEAVWATSAGSDLRSPESLRADEGHVGRIALEHEGVRRHLGEMPPDPQVSLVGGGAARTRGLRPSARKASARHPSR